MTDETKPKSFSVDTQAAPGQVAPGQTATVAFTVTNVSAQALDGTVAVDVPENGPTPLAWFAINGPATRPYQPGGIENVEVLISVPLGTLPGDHSFQLDAMSTESSEEDFTPGPLQPFSVKEEQKAVPWWRRYWWIIAIAAVVLIGIVLAIVLVSRGDDELTAPVPLEPADGTVFNNFPRTTRLRWEPVDGAEKYRVERQFCQGSCESQATPFGTSDVTETEFTFDFVGAQPGRWRVSAIDEAGVEGPKSPFRGFSYTR